MRHTQETLAKLSEMRRGSRNPFFGRKHTPETIARMRAATRAYNATRQYEPAPQQIVVPTDPAFLGYLAGMIDADGSCRFKRGRPFLSVYNTHRPLIEMLATRLGHGCISKGNKGREQVMAWTISGARDVYALVLAVRPHLVVKASDADAVLAFYLGRYGWHSYSVGPDA